MATPIRVLIVDDSAIVRRVLTEGLSHCTDIEVVGSAIDPYVARDKILQLNPDVITLDIEMPRMDGLTFLKLIMKHRPMPVIVMSSLTAAGSAMALEALQAGAVEVLEKPAGSFSAYEDSCKLAEVIRAAARAKIRRYVETSDTPATPVTPQSPPVPASTPPPAHSPVPAHPPAQNHVPAAVAHPAPKTTPPNRGRHYGSRKIILMGASTGGTEALRAVLTQLSGDLPGICVVQHIPAQFSLAFANRLNTQCQLEVREAKNGDVVRPGLVLIAPGGFHMMLRWNGAAYDVLLNEGPKIHYQRPAVDVLFNSAVKAGAAPHALAVLLTGMGSDGAQGMLDLFRGGANTVAQNEETCVVFGMPREAIRLGAAKAVLPLHQIPKCIERYGDENAGKN